MTARFTKMAGGGNDFVVFSDSETLAAPPEALARRICTRALSVGADGILLVGRGSVADVRMIYYNSDGSRAFCANGTRCAARFAFVNALAPARMTIETDAGVVDAEVFDDRVRLTLPPPSDFEPDAAVTLGDGREITASFIRVGVPHAVVFLAESLWSDDIEPAGREIRHHDRFGPDGANVNFVHIVDPHHFEIRTYERGVEGETLSCGSGVVASTIVAAISGKAAAPVQLLTRSGIELTVSYRTDPADVSAVSDVQLIGDARIIYRSTIEQETLTGFDPFWVKDPTAGRPTP